MKRNAAIMLAGVLALTGIGFLTSGEEAQAMEKAVTCPEGVGQSVLEEPCSNILKVFSFTNKENSSQDELWVDFDAITYFNRPNSTKGWSCSVVDDSAGGFDDQFDCSGSAIAKGKTLKLAFRNQQDPEVEHWNWGERDGDNDAIPLAQIVCADPVGGIAELPEIAQAQLDTTGSSPTSYALLAGVVTATTVGAITLIGTSWYARRRWVR